jgi:16S rRNA (cytosine967-C5)-methyltransferase
MEPRRAWAEDLLTEALHRNSLTGADARLLRELVFGTLKAQLFLDYVLKSFYKSDSTPPRKIVNLLRLGAYQMLLLSKIPPHAAVHATVELAKGKMDARQVAFVNAVLRSLGRQGAPALPPREKDEVAYLSVLHSLPAWLVRRWLERFGWEAAECLMHTANEAPPVVARVNALRGDRDAALGLLEKQGVEHAALEAPMAVHISGGDPGQIPGVAEGWFYFQDQASQWVGYLVDPEPGQTCIDWCSAPGGKATHLAELMRNQGHVWSHDVSQIKLRKVEENARRLGITCLRTATSVPKELRADRVLVDAPCSGLGTLRRHAETRWRIREQDLARLAKTQITLLEQAASHVRLGGHLIYATCTTEPEENENVVNSFLKQHPEFTLKIGPGANGNPPQSYWDSEGFFRTYPRHKDMDGMFAARLLLSGE